jgi:hypothetical protein
VSKSIGQPAFVLVQVRVRIDRSWESEGKIDLTMLGSYGKGPRIVTGLVPEKTHTPPSEIRENAEEALPAL